MPTWRERIVAARERGEFLEDDRVNAREWETCAIGENAERHSAFLRVLPVKWMDKDADDLVEWGLAFDTAVSKNDFSGAESLLDQIEDRVLELKRGEV